MSRRLRGGGLLEPQFKVGSRPIVPGLPLGGGLAIDAGIRTIPWDP